MAFIMPYPITYKKTVKPKVAYQTSKAVVKAKPRTVTKTRRKRIERTPYRPMTVRRPKKVRLVSHVTAGTGSTFSRYTTGTTRKTRAIYDLFKQNEEYVQSYIQSFRLTAAYGQQAVKELPFNNNVTWTTLAGNLPTGLGTINNVAKIIFGDTMSRTTFTNQDIATCYVRIYEIEPRFHMQTINAPVNAWNTGLQDQTQTAATYQDVYELPFSSEKFTLFHNVKKIFQFELQQGQSHSHQSMYHINKGVHGQIVNAYQLIRDVTKYQMFVVSGTPLNDSTTLTNVSTSSIAIDIVNSYKTSYTFAASTNNRKFHSNILPAITIGETISIGAGAKANDTNA